MVNPLFPDFRRNKVQNRLSPLLQFFFISKFQQISTISRPIYCAVGIVIINMFSAVLDSYSLKFPKFLISNFRLNCLICLQLLASDQYCNIYERTAGILRNKFWKIMRCSHMFWNRLQTEVSVTQGGLFCLIKVLRFNVFNVFVI